MKEFLEAISEHWIVSIWISVIWFMSLDMILKSISERRKK